MDISVAPAVCSEWWDTVTSVSEYSTTMSNFCLLDSAFMGMGGSKFLEMSFKSPVREESNSTVLASSENCSELAKLRAEALFLQVLT